MTLLREYEHAATDSWLVMTQWRGREKKRKRVKRGKMARKSELDR